MSNALDILHSALPIYAQKYVEKAVAGDEEAALSLVYASPNRLRSVVLVQLHNALGIWHPAVRGALAEVWRHDHPYLLHDLGRSRTNYFLLWGGTRPADLPARVTVWRGGRGDPKSVSRGWSWTTDRDTAIWFGAAWRVGEAQDDPPCIVKATVSSARIVHHDNERGEHEVVIFGCKGAVVDGDANEWKWRSKEVEAVRQAENAARIAKYSVAAA
jgi:hypothetical protein